MSESPRWLIILLPFETVIDRESGFQVVDGLGIRRARLEHEAVASRRVHVVLHSLDDGASGSDFAGAIPWQMGQTMDGFRFYVFVRYFLFHRPRHSSW